MPFTNDRSRSLNAKGLTGMVQPVRPLRLIVGKSMPIKHRAKTLVMAYLYYSRIYARATTNDLQN
jgi:hypothetical protein